MSESVSSSEVPFEMPYEEVSFEQGGQSPFDNEEVAPNVSSRKSEYAGAIKSYRDLEVWTNGIRLSELVYELTEQFPQDERFGIASQMRRCAVSIPSNIAEGFMRKNTKEYMQFLYISLGSIGELDTQLELCKRLGYPYFGPLEYELLVITRKQLFGLTKVLSKRITKK